jgi:fatty-acyl-CoA synthase
LTTAADLLLRRADDDSPALLFQDQAWSYRDLVREGQRRAAVYARLHDPDRPPHIGILLENGPEYFFWLAGAALCGAVAVGVNATYRGAQLAQLVAHTDCDVVVTEAALAPLLDGCDLDLPSGSVLTVDEPAYADVLAATRPTEERVAAVTDDTLYLLVFTSGSTGMPKAVRCTQGRFAATGLHVATIAAMTGTDVSYIPSPLFHTSALFVGWSPALNIGTPVATRPRFSASGTLPDVRRVGATFMNYTGKLLNYILATPEAADDATCPLRLVVGNEASAWDIKEFSRRFGCDVRDSYGSTEGLIIIRRDPSMPEGSIGTANPSVKVVDSETGVERPRAAFGPDGRVLNLEAAIGEIVETAPSSAFEGYYKNPEATRTRFRDGWYWSGDLAYRDADGWFYFAGRANDWIRVDGENFATAPVEAILGRHLDVRSVAVYAVPDDPVGDRVMAAIEMRDGAVFDAVEFDGFLRAQPDLSPKWIPAFVRVLPELPKLASMKIDRQRLRRDAWRAPDVEWRPARGEALRPLSDTDRAAIDHLLH